MGGGGNRSLVRFARSHETPPPIISRVFCECDKLRISCWMVTTSHVCSTHRHLSRITLGHRTRWYCHHTKTLPTPPFPHPNPRSRAVRIAGTKTALYLESAQHAANGLVLGQKEENGHSNCTPVQVLAQFLHSLHLPLPYPPRWARDSLTVN